jgi:predicted  nucleic acid-binding Zn-ribbon protein
MTEVLETLVKIQRLDTNIEQTQKEIEAIPEKITAFEKDVEKAERSLQDKKKRVQEISKEYKSREGDIAANETKIAKLNSQTFAVKTNEEYRAILHEIEFLKNENRRIEDEMIAMLEEEERLNSTLDAFEKETGNTISERTHRIGDLNKHRETLLDSVEAMKAEFENLFNQLPEETQELYQKIKKVRGKAVCLIENETCTGCYASLTPQFMNELKKKKEILLCAHCGRILIFGTADTNK